MEPSGDEFQAVRELRPRRRIPAPPRSLFRRRLLDYALAAAILLVCWRSSRRGSTASRRGRISGDAVVNDGDSITLKGERIRLRGIDAPEYNQTCLKDGATYPCGRRSREALARLRRAAGSNARAGSATATAACSPSARPAASTSTGGRWRRAGRSPMATMPTPSRRRAQRGAGLWAGIVRAAARLARRAWRDGRGRARPVRRGWSTGCGRSSAFHEGGLCCCFDKDTEEAMKLFDGGRAPNPRRVRIFLAEKGISVPLVPVDMAALEHKKEAISSRNPLMRLPVLELDDGTILTETIAICRYFEELQPQPVLFGTRRARQGGGRDVAAAPGVQPVRRGRRRLPPHPSGDEGMGDPAGPGMGRGQQAEGGRLHAHPRPRAGNPGIRCRRRLFGRRHHRAGARSIS